MNHIFYKSVNQSDRSSVATPGNTNSFPASSLKTGVLNFLNTARSLPRDLKEMVKDLYFILFRLPELSKQPAVATRREPRRQNKRAATNYRSIN